MLNKSSNLLKGSSFMHFKVSIGICSGVTAFSFLPFFKACSNYSSNIPNTSLSSLIISISSVLLFLKKFWLVFNTILPFTSLSMAGTLFLCLLFYYINCFLFCYVCWSCHGISGTFLSRHTALLTVILSLVWVCNLFLYLFFYISIRLYFGSVSSNPLSSVDLSSFTVSSFIILLLKFLFYFWLFLYLLAICFLLHHLAILVLSLSLIVPFFIRSFIGSWICSISPPV